MFSAVVTVGLQCMEHKTVTITNKQEMLSFSDLHVQFSNNPQRISL